MKSSVSENLPRYISWQQYWQKLALGMTTLAIICAIVIILALTVLIYLKHRLSQITDTNNLEAAIEIEVEKIYRGRRPPIGLVVGVYKDRKTYINGFGKSSLQSNTTPDSKTVFQIASVGKIFTASALQILSDDGILNINATVGELIGDRMQLSPAVARITLRQLATHTSGFPRIPKYLMNKVTEKIGSGNIMDNPFSHLGPECIFEYLKTADDIKKPGRFAYSNFGMGLLGHILEIVSETPFEDLVKDKLLIPLGMKNSGITLTQEMKANLTQGYTAKGEPATLWTFRTLAGAGGFSSTLDDMMMYVRALLDGDHSLSSSLKKTTGEQAGEKSGVGWMTAAWLDKFFGNHEIRWHNGLVGGYASYVSVDVSKGSGVIVLSSSAIDMTMLGMMLTRQARIHSWSP